MLPPAVIPKSDSGDKDVSGWSFVTLGYEMEYHGNVMDMSRECHVNVMEMTLECHWNIMGISWKCNGPGQQSSNRAKSRKLYIEDMGVARKSVGKKPSWLAFHTGGQTSWTCGPIISCSRGMLPVQASCSNMNPKSFKIAVGGPSKYDCKA